MGIKQVPTAKAQMLIRKPVIEVFETFINPEITTKFWFTKSTDRLEEGKQITWTWEMDNISTQVIVKTIEENSRIVMEWDAPDKMTRVEWTFIPYKNKWTYIIIVNSGFAGDGDSVVTQASDSVGGFTTVVDGAKAWLEHSINLNLIMDKCLKRLTEY